MGSDGEAPRQGVRAVTPKAERSIEPLLSRYVAGALDPWLYALVESHLLLSPENRDRVIELEAEAGEFLEGGDPGSFRRAARDHVLAAIYAGGWYGRPQPEPLDPVMPRPIARLVGRPFSSLEWRFLAPGLRTHVVHDDGRLTAALVRLAAGRRIPAHTHDGPEAMLVLQGGLSDGAATYLRGDVALADETIGHRPAALPDEPCVCFAVTQGAVRLTGPIARLVQRVLSRR